MQTTSRLTQKAAEVRPPMQCPPSCKSEILCFTTETPTFIGRIIQDTVQCTAQPLSEPKRSVSSTAAITQAAETVNSSMGWSGERKKEEEKKTETSLVVSNEKFEVYGQIKKNCLLAKNVGFQMIFALNYKA